MSTQVISKKGFSAALSGIRLERGLVFGIIILAALFAFEIFNFSTTEFALSDLLGDLQFIGLRWATILAVAFCGIDFAGIARLFTPEDGGGKVKEIWYLFGAWLLAATMNAMLTWWGVSTAILNNPTLGNAAVDREILLRVVPVFVAVLVWLIRVLIIGSFSVAGERIFSQGSSHKSRRRAGKSGNRYTGNAVKPTPVPAQMRQKPAGYAGEMKGKVFNPSPKSPRRQPVPGNLPDPTYHQDVKSAAGYAAGQYPSRKIPVASNSETQLHN